MDDPEGGTTGIMEALLYATGIFFTIVHLVSLVVFVAAVCYLFAQPRNQPNRNLLLWTLILRLLLAAHAAAVAYLPLYTGLGLVLVMVYQEILRVPLLFVTLYAAARYRKTMARKERRAFLCISLVYGIAILEVILLSLVSIPLILTHAFSFS